MSQQDEKKDSVRHSGMECVGGMYPILHEMLKEKKVKGESFFYPHVEHVLFESVLVPNPAVPKGSKPTVVAKDFSYLSEVRRLLEADKTREIIVDGLEFGAFGAVQSIRKELTGGNCRLKSTMIRQIRPITAPQNDRYEELCGCVLITGGAGGLGKLYREYLLYTTPPARSLSLSLSNLFGKSFQDERKRCARACVCVCRAFKCSLRIFSPPKSTTAARKRHSDPKQALLPRVHRGDHVALD